MAEVEESLKRIMSHKGVAGVLIVNNDGIAVRSTLDTPTTVMYAGLIHQLTSKARGCIRDIDPTNDLCFFRLHTKKHEVMVAPDKEYMLIVIQENSDK